MVKEKTTVVVTVEYKFEVPDSKIAGILADVISEKNSGTSFTDNWSIWDLDATEKVISSEVV